MKILSTIGFSYSIIIASSFGLQYPCYEHEHLQQQSANYVGNIKTTARPITVFMNNRNAQELFEILLSVSVIPVVVQWGGGAVALKQCHLECVCFPVLQLFYHLLSPN